MAPETRLGKLKELEEQLYDMMQKANSRAMPALARQYRDTIREIDMIEGGNEQDDLAAIILRHREPDTD